MNFSIKFGSRKTTPLGGDGRQQPPEAATETGERPFGVVKWAFSVKNSSVLNSFRVTVISSPPRVISVLESIITSSKKQA
jgi:hypothetical protein